MSGLKKLLTNSIGGADGFGSAIVDRFCSEACRVIILDLSKEKGENKARSNPNLYFLEADVTLAETWDRALLYVKSMFGRLDVVVNNAGLRHNLNQSSDRVLTICRRNHF